MFALTKNRSWRLTGGEMMKRPFFLTNYCRVGLSRNCCVLAGFLIVVCAPLMISFFKPVSAQTQLITNGDFESGWTGWVHTGGFYADSRFPARAHSGSGYAYLSAPDGSPGNNLSGTFARTVTIPASALSATLTFWVSVNTAETGAVERDILRVTAGGAPLIAISNAEQPPLTSPHFYLQYSFDLTSRKGSNVTISFVATTDGSNPTIFRVDDVALNVTTTPPKSDLIVQSLSVNPTNGLAGSSLTMSFTIRNQGAGPA